LAASRIKLGLQKQLTLGNLHSKRDWGYAPEYCEGMWRILQQEQPDDFVLATGETHTIKEFAEEVFSQLDLPLVWKGSGENEQGIDKNGNVLVAVDPKYYRPTEVELLIGNPKKAKEKLGWQATTTFKELARLMANADFEKVKKRGY